MYDVVVIGAGQAGLAAAYHLKKRELNFVVLDANDGPGGAWRHRWDSLTLDAAHHIHELPGYSLPQNTGETPASQVVSEYYRGYEEKFSLPVQRPVQVRTLQRQKDSFTVITDHGEFSTKTVISATGTWDKPHWPYYPGITKFTGLQQHTHDFRTVDDYHHKRTLVVGGGASAVQFLIQLADAGVQTFWSTRQPPQWNSDIRSESTSGRENWGRNVEKSVLARTTSGEVPLSVVSATGLQLHPHYQKAIATGVLVSRGKISQLSETTVTFNDSSVEKIDAILWATGFRAALDHLRELHLRTNHGGINMLDSVRVAADDRLFLVGYGPSASTLGATRAGRAAAVAAATRATTP